MLRVTADTNILVSGLNFPGNPRRMLAAAESGAIRLKLSLAILDEVAEVLQRQKFGWSVSEAKAATDWLAHIADVVEPMRTLDIIKSDPDDNRVLECAQESRSDYIISGDKHLLGLGSIGSIPIATIADFLRKIQESARNV